MSNLTKKEHFNYFWSSEIKIISIYEIYSHIIKLEALLISKMVSHSKFGQLVIKWLMNTYANSLQT